MKIISIEGLDKSATGFSGIYAIKNIETEKLYIGSTTNALNRWSHHKHFLKGIAKESPKHKNSHLQKDWDFYGEDSFELFLLEETTKECLLQKEQEWIDKVGLENLYNVTDAIRTTLPDEMRKNISKGRMGVKFSDEHRKALSDSHKGKPWSKERRDAHRVGVQDKSLTFEKAKEIRSLKEKGKTYKELALLYQVSERTIYDVVSNKYYKDDNYIPLVKKRKRIPVETMNEVLRRVASGEKVSSLGKEFDISPTTIYDYLKKENDR